MDWRLPLTALVQASAAILFLTVAGVLMRREVSPRAQAAHESFIMWWSALGLYNGTLAVLAWAAHRMAIEAEAALAVRIVQLILLGLAGTALITYVLYLAFGHRRALWSAAVYYLGVSLWFLWFTFRHRPVGVDPDGWLAEVQYAVPLDTTEYRLLLVAFTLPILLGTVLYLRLYRTVGDRWARYRVALVGSTLFLWISTGFLGRLFQNETTIYAAAVGLGTIAALAAFLAYIPPPVIRRWLMGGHGPGNGNASG